MVADALVEEILNTYEVGSSGSTAMSERRAPSSISD
jgi:hypothetical protein